MSSDPVPADDLAGPNDDAGESDLVARIQAGDRAAFYRIIQQHTDALWQLAYAYLKSRADADDLLQDLFFHIWRARGHWTPRGTIGSYLALAVRRRALNVLKHRRVESAYLERVSGEVLADPELGAESGPEAQFLTQEEYSASRAIIEKLSDRFKIALLLRYEQQRSFAEIAEILEILMPAARQLTFRALEQLRKLARP